MACPQISPEEVVAAIPGASDVSHIDDGGQKRVFRVRLSGNNYAVKFMRPVVQQLSTSEFATEPSLVDNVTARATREVDTLRQCKTPYLVKLGPIGLESAKIGSDTLLYFSEEYIDGESLTSLLKAGTLLNVNDLVELGTQITLAIQELWSFSKIHRDVKPNNIMRRKGDGSFVLLDMGLVFDLDDRSFSLGPVGTAAYFSPEQVDFRNRRSILDFRSDIFSLGIVLYMMATGQHPFAAGANNSWEIIANIQTLSPTPPKQLREEIPDELSALILRLLGKRPALRYRTPQMLLDALKSVPK